MLQTVNMQFGDGDDGPTAVLTMNAFTRNLSRKTVVSGNDRILGKSSEQSDVSMFTICLLQLS